MPVVRPVVRFGAALVLCALPTAALAQEVTCQACDHVAPYFRGPGGFIGTVAEGADEVVFVASCGGVSTTGPARIHGDTAGPRTASQLFNHRNGVACDQEGGSLQIAGLEDGGWYWITDEDNSAVGNLVAKGVLGNRPTPLTSAGPGVSMRMGRGAVFLKEASSGRVGILPNILPAPAEARLRKCGFFSRGSGASTTYHRLLAECALGDGGAVTLATVTNPFSGATTRVPGNSALTRPGGSASLQVIVDLWGNDSGFFTTEAPPGGNPRLGQLSVALAQGGRANRLTGVEYAATLGAGPNATSIAGDAEATGGITLAQADNAATITIVRHADYCSSSNNNAATVSVRVTMPIAASATQVTPPVQRNESNGAVGGTAFTVLCP